jgi:predicted site-specific integrase-resolvase
MPRLSPNKPAPNNGALAFTLSQATQVSGLSRSTLRRRGKEGALRLFRAGGRMMVDGASLRRFLGAGA